MRTRSFKGGLERLEAIVNKLTEHDPRLGRIGRRENRTRRDECDPARLRDGHFFKSVKDRLGDRVQQQPLRRGCRRPGKEHQIADHVADCAGPGADGRQVMPPIPLRFVSQKDLSASRDGGQGIVDLVPGGGRKFSKRVDLGGLDRFLLLRLRFDESGLFDEPATQGGQRFARLRWQIEPIGRVEHGETHGAFDAREADQALGFASRKKPAAFGRAICAKSWSAWFGS